MGCLRSAALRPSHPQALAAVLLMLGSVGPLRAGPIQPGEQVGPGMGPGGVAPAALSPANPGSTQAVTPEVAPAPTGQVTIESDRQQADNVTGIITASGNVRIVYPDRRVVATSRQAQYFTREGMIILSGDVDVIQDDGNTLQADRVTYLVERERALAQPLEGQQVFSTLLIQTTPQIQPAGVPVPQQTPSQPLR